MTVTPTEHNAEFASTPTTGSFAMLRGLFRVQGIGAPSRRPARIAVSAASIALLCLALSSAPASAEFTRRTLCQITGPFVEAGSVAVDGSDNLWVDAPGDPSDLYKYDPGYSSCGTFAGPKPGPGPLEIALDHVGYEPPNSLIDPRDSSLAIEDTSGQFYVGGAVTNGTNGFLGAFDTSGEHAAGWLKEDIFSDGRNGLPVHVAVDNNPAGDLGDPSACTVSGCTVYVSSEAPNGIEKLNSKNEKVDFSGLQGNEITSAPVPGCENELLKGGEPFQGAMTVDPEGDIYLIPGCALGAGAVLEFGPSGEFVRDFSFTSEEVPPLELANGDRAVGDLTAVAYDPVSGHLLVGATHGGRAGESVGALYEFDAATGKYVGRITEAAGEQIKRPVGLAVDSHGDVYLLDRRSEVAPAPVVDALGHGEYLPSLDLGAASAREPASATLNGQVDPEGFPLSECEFEYVPQAQFEAGEFKALTGAERSACVPSVKAINEQGLTGFHQVTAAAAPLVSGTTYRYRIVATSEGEEGGTADSEVFAFTAPAAPALGPATATNLSSTFVDLHAQINPLGSATTYRFEYDTTPYAGEGRHGLSVPVPDASIGSGGPTGSSPEAVVQHVGGLAPDTTYHFRLLAENGVGARFGPDEMFTTLPQAAPGLPDGRAYELVTPADKQGGSDMFAQPVDNGEYFNTDDLAIPAQSGEALLLETFSAFGAFPAAGHSAYVLRRDYARGEWAYRSLTSPSLGVQTNVSTIFDQADLSRVAVNDGVGARAGSEGQRLVNLFGQPGGPYTTLHEGAPSYASGQYTEMIVGASRDLGHVVLQSEDPGMCPGPENVGLKVTHGDVLCEWDGGYETLEDGSTRPEMKLVNLNSEGELLSTCGAALGVGGVLEGGASWGYRAVSTDGSRVVFTAPDPGVPGSSKELSGPGCWNAASEHETGKPAAHTPRLYMRVGGETLELSAPEPGLEEPGSKEPEKRPVPYPAAFAGASEDDSRVFFVTKGWLTANHPKVHDQELYECEIVTGGEDRPECKLTRVSAGEEGSEGEAAGAHVYGVTAVAGEGQAVYYLAFGALAEGASEHEASEPGDTRSGGSVNLYRYAPATATAPARTSYVAEVDTLDNPTQGAVCRDAVLEVAPCANLNWYTTPDGRYLLFGASLPIAGYNEAYGCPVSLPKQNSHGADGRCLVLYRYDAQAAEHGEQPIVCVSCNPSGAQPAGSAQFTRAAPSGPAAAPVRAMSGNGEYVFFDAPDALVPAATNGSLNVYEWHDGQIALISSGSDPAPSFFLGYAPNPAAHTEQAREGGNVFIGTHSRLSPQQTNTVGNIYSILH